MGRSGMKGAQFRVRVGRLLEAAGLAGEFTAHRLHGGANNRVFHVEVGGRHVLLKAYFHHPNDPRDRLGAEFAFTTFAWNNGVRSLPEPLASDPAHHLGLYQFIPGEPVAPGQVDSAVIDQALSFYSQVNQSRRQPAAAALPPASESYFSIAQHLRQVDRRVRNLCAIEESTAIDREAARFVRQRLLGAWLAIVERTRRSAAHLGLEPEAQLPAEQWRLSPSDFGFHNAIVGLDGRLRFIDFEYAGWDDPAKMVCDFLCQTKRPVPASEHERFMSQALADLANPQLELQRTKMLLPVYRIKWICIVLNDFAPAGRARRRFALGASELAQYKVDQLARARSIFEILSPQS